MKESPLIDEHRKRKAKMILFAGWKMPLQFTSPKEEHLHVRKHVGLFDVSHMGQIRIQGEQALEFLSTLVTNNISQVEEYKSQYHLLCHEKGGILDDLIIYCIKKNSDYLLCVNAATCEKDFQWIKQHSPSFSVTVEDESSRWGLIAIQGPLSQKLVQLIFGNVNIKRFHFQWASYHNQKVMISRTGYTGEDGFEIFTPISLISTLWQECLSHENILPIAPIGLAARDTLRLEMKYPLYGTDMDDSTTPIEMGLSWACKNPFSFIGKDSFVREKKRKWVGFKVLEDSGIPRKSFPIFTGNKQIGYVTSGALSPSLGDRIGLAMVQKDFSKVGTKFQIQIHGKPIEAQVAPTPFINS